MSAFQKDSEISHTGSVVTTAHRVGGWEVAMSQWSNEAMKHGKRSVAFQLSSQVGRASKYEMQDREIQKDKSSSTLPVNWDYTRQKDAKCMKMKSSDEGSRVVFLHLQIFVKQFNKEFLLSSKECDVFKEPSSSSDLSRCPRAGGDFISPVVLDDFLSRWIPCIWSITESSPPAPSPIEKDYHANGSDSNHSTQHARHDFCADGYLVR